MASYPGPTNLEVFKRHRANVERDAAAPSVGRQSEAFAVIAAWQGRYMRRRDAILGAFAAKGLEDKPLAEKLAALWRSRDEAVPGTPNWPRDFSDAANMTYANMARMGRLDAAGPEAAHAFGPSLRALWLEAEAKGEDPKASILAWSRALPKNEKARLAPKAALARSLAWRETGDVEAPWEAEVDGTTWRIWLNDFPEAPAYALWSGERHLGDIHDWPEMWARGPEAAAPRPRVVERPRAPIAAPERLVDRYRAGEHEKVWAELIALGPDVRQAPYAEPAAAVAQETMRRVRANIGLLIPRLQALGYAFGGPPEADPSVAPMTFGGSAGAKLSRLDELLQRAQGASAIPQSARSQLLGMIGALQGAAKPKAKPKAAIADALKNPDVFRPAKAADAKIVAKLERRRLVLPLSLRAWAEEVGFVDLTGSHPELCPIARDGAGQFLADPLSIVADAEWLETEAGDWNAHEDAPFPLFIGHSAQSKAAANADEIDPDDSYSITVPDKSADGLISGAAVEEGFVAYLRRALRNGGFAGWDGAPSRPSATIARLTEGFATF